MRGKIIKGIGGFYYIHTGEALYECKAKGIFRKEKMKPLVGDNVQIDVLDEEKKLGSIVQILPRLNSLIRPAVANVDQAVVIFAMARPEPNLNLLDRFLVMMQMQGIKTLICFNKTDIAEPLRHKSRDRRDLFRFYNIYQAHGVSRRLSETMPDGKIRKEACSLRP